ncbi:cupin [Patescibacteria group bacterium]|nr:cupin [Patescibacteria group bacterium]
MNSTKPKSTAVKIEKPWGFEIILTPENLDRAGKILFVKKGQRLSLQYHDQKEETLCLFSGKALLWLENENSGFDKIQMQLKRGYLISPMEKHRLEAQEDCYIFEISSPEKGTTFRLEDDYGRRKETEENRKTRAPK